MTHLEARKILGLGPAEDPRPHLPEYRVARERIAEMVRSAPNDTLADRYQQGLIEFDQALAAIREFLEEPAAENPELTPAPSPNGEPEDESASGLNETDDTAATGPRTFSGFVWLLVFVIGAAGGGFLYVRNEEAKETRRQERLALLDRMGSEFIDNRRWQEAGDLFAEIEALAPGSELARFGRRRIEAGMAEEQNQFVGYWTGQAIAELEVGRLDEAEAAIRRVIGKFPSEKEAPTILEQIAKARAGQAREMALANARKLLNETKPEEAINAARGVLANTPDDPDATAIIEEATAVLEKQAADRAMAMSLLAQAADRDHGEFDQQALDWLREAASLAPENAEIAAKLEAMASYTRTLRIPGDYATPAEALAVARDRDRVVLTEQTWKGPLVINTAVDLQGEGSTKTIVECPATEDSAITIGPDAKGARITGIGFRHESFLVTGSDRFSAALVRGGTATFTDCAFSDASGHGLVVIEHGEAVANRCHFSGNGWNGVAAIGTGCKLEVRDSESTGNFEHGIESWDGAAVTLVNNRCEANSRNGIHTDNGAAAAIIKGNQLIANREFGLVLDSAGSGKISGNTARANLLGGFVIRAAAAKLPVTGNRATLNQGPGLVLESGLSAASYAENTMTKNDGAETLTGANLSDQEENAPDSSDNAPHR